MITTDLPSSAVWIASTFENYIIPSDIGKNVTDPLDDHIQHRCQSHYLGPAYIKSGNHPAIQVDFYKVTRSEISELVYDMKKSGRRSSYGGTDIYGDGGTSTALSSPEGTDNCHYLSEATPEQLNLSATSVTGVTPPTHTIPLILPPKKRKKRRVIQQFVIFSLTKYQGPLSPGDTYYLFPKNSLLATMDDMVTLQVHCTFRLSKPPRPSVPSTNLNIETPPSNIKYRTKLEELAAICSSTEHLGSHELFPLSDTEYDSIHVEISDASVDLYYSLKEIVAGCQVPGQEMAKLAGIHAEYLKTINNRTLLLEKTVVQGIRSTTGNGSTMSTDQQLLYALQDNTKRKHMLINTGDKDPLPTLKKKKKAKRASINHGKQDTNASNKTRQCAYCGVTSTPMWRRGPEGAGTLCNACGVKWKHGKILTGDDTSGNHQHLGKTTDKRNKPTTWTSKKEKQIKASMNDSAASTDLQLHEHIYYAQQTIQYDSSTSIHERISGDLTAPSPSPTSSLNESLGHSPFTSFTSSPTSIGSQQHTLALTKKLGLNNDDLALTSAAADVEAAAVLTLLSQS